MSRDSTDVPPGSSDTRRGVGWQLIYDSMIVGAGINETVQGAMTDGIRALQQCPATFLEPLPNPHSRLEIKLWPIA